MLRHELHAQLGNHAHIYEHSTEASEFSHEAVRAHIAQRGDSYEAATLIHRVLANNDPAVTAHTYSTRTSEEALPDRVRELLTQRAAACQHRNHDYEAWKTQQQEHARYKAEAQEQHIDRSHHRGADYGLEL